jgi:hypothetical protein
MSVTVEKLPHEPIVIVTIIGQLNITMMREAYAQIATILDACQPPVYRITDARAQETSFADMLDIIKEASHGMPGTTTDPRVCNIFVGRDKFARLAREAYINTGHPIPLFDTLEDALTYIHHELSSQQDHVDSGTPSLDT